MNDRLRRRLRAKHRVRPRHILEALARSFTYHMNDPNKMGRGFIMMHRHYRECLRLIEEELARRGYGRDDS